MSNFYGDGLHKQSGCDIVVAVVGNPNVGKSTLFNVLTGETVHVGNWPGVTVELKQGEITYEGRQICLVDLPGIYGISATSPEEVISREFIINAKPDVILVLVDSTAPERTLYLPIQILELTSNVVIAFTKIDEAHSKGVHIHIDKLEEKLGVPVVATSALKGIGVRDLLNAITKVAEGNYNKKRPLKIEYNGIEPFISEIEEIIKYSKALDVYPKRWAAIRLLESDERLEEILRTYGESNVLEAIKRVRESIRRSIGKEPSELIVTMRFNFVDKLAREVVVRIKKMDHGSEFLENLFQKPIVGALVSTFLLFGTFSLIFAINTGFPLNVIFEMLGLESLAEDVENFSISGILGETFTLMAEFVRQSLINQVPEWLVSLIADGIISGVGSILTFFPLILMVFLFLAMLEDSGLAPRMAVSFHSLLSKFGLSGRAIYPIIISLGCNVPGVMASRTSIEDEERSEIIFSISFIPCQARLIVALAFALAFFNSPLAQAAVILLVYLAGFIVSLLSALMMRRVYFSKIEPPELIIELPPLHKPKAKVVWWLSWDNTKHFLRKAGIIIFALSIVVWILMFNGPTGYLGNEGSVDFSSSYAAILGRWVSPALRPLGLSDEQGWKLGFALINGFVAKEVVLDALTLFYGEAVDPIEAIRDLGISWAQGLSILLFITLYIPCLATLAVIYQESKNLKLTIIALLYMLSLAYVVSILVYGVLSIFTLT
jgi:ferrous iron transport protein B